jgi:hypothetical protein
MLVTGGKQILTVKLFFLLDFSVIDFELSTFKLFDISSHGFVQQYIALRPGTFSTFRFIEGLEFTTKSIECFFTVDTVHFGLLGIIGNDIPAPAGAFSGKDFFNVQVVFDNLKPARMTQGSFVQMNTAKLFAKDILPAGTLKDTAVFIAGHAAIHDPYHAADVPGVEIFLDPIHSFGIVLVSIQH